MQCNIILCNALCKKNSEASKSREYLEEVQSNVVTFLLKKIEIHLQDQMEGMPHHQEGKHNHRQGEDKPYLSSSGK